MLKLLYMVACESVIINAEDSSASLINLFEGMTVETEQELPVDAELPHRWFVYSMWRREEPGGRQGFVQKFEMISPSGRKARENETPFAFSEGKYNHRVRLNVFGMPIGEAGIWALNLYVKEDLPNAQWSHLGSMPIHIQIKRMQSEEPAAEATTEAQ